ncbi:MAG TPA: choice-of-anchor tandem repeat GloVer-containing protein [Terriglobales bacterium]|nr:choice-of-anchor tandem repeat GloVer-containing protein [Terriglobales bacterium]
MRQKTFWIAASCVLVMIGLRPVFSSGAAPASNEKVIYSFTGGADGGQPMSDLTLDADGNLYGTTEYGGSGACTYNTPPGCGTVFELKRSKDGWKEQVLYSFAGGNDGAVPKAGVVFDKAGNLYGTTAQGGRNGGGTAFEMVPNSHGGWKESILHAFPDGSDDGASPESDLILDTQGNLYGTAMFGGAENSCAYSGCGTVFALTPHPDGSWTETTLHVFAGAPDGASPSSGVVLDSAGNLYGTTSYGGSGSCYVGTKARGYVYGCGTVYKLTAPGGAWTETILYNFVHGGGLGINPSGQIILDNANHILGVTDAGGNGLGTFFELQDTKNRGWRQSQAHIFYGNPDGMAPVGRLVSDSHANLLGITSHGGASKSGIVFEFQHLSDGWEERILYSFAGSPDGATPSAGLVSDSLGVLYGTTLEGGTSTGSTCHFQGCGTIYQVAP